MHIFIVVTLLFASATAALGLPKAMFLYRKRYYGWLSAGPPILNTFMMIWFGFAALWMLWHL